MLWERRGGRNSMRIVINLVIISLANIVSAFSLFIIPEYKISLKKLFIELLIFGLFIGSIKYFVRQTARLILLLYC